MTTDGDLDFECEVEFVQVNEDAILPTREHGVDDSGWDLYSTQELTLFPNCRSLVDTGWRIGIPSGWEGQVRPRSGNAIKKGLTVLNTPGTVDASYRGVLKVILMNAGAMPIDIKVGDKIAQIVFQRVPNVCIKVVTEFSTETSRGTKGFGSSGVVGG